MNTPILAITPTYCFLENDVERSFQQVFPPCFREPNGPPLELFDLDEELSSESRRLAQLANKCTDVDLPYFLLQCGQVLGIEAASGEPKHVIEHVLTRLVEFRKLNQVGSCSLEPFERN